MSDVREELRQLVKAAAALHRSEQALIYESVLAVGRLEHRNAAVNLGLSQAKLAAKIHLSRDQYCKRAQVARIILFFPEAGRMLKDGDAELSQLVMLSAKLTRANAHLLLPAVKSMSCEELRRFAARVTPEGEVLAETVATVVVRLELTVAEHKQLDRLREVLAASAHVPSTKEIFMTALSSLLELRDPLRKAERARGRRERQDAATRHAGGGMGKITATEVTSEPAGVKSDTGAYLCATRHGERVHDACPAAAESDTGADLCATRHRARAHDACSAGAESDTGADLCATRHGESPHDAGSVPSSTPARADAAVARQRDAARHRPAVPAAIRHDVWLRDQGRCAWVLEDGSRCEERTMIELDHVEPWCRGGGHTADNLKLACRRHNAGRAAAMLGEQRMREWRTPRRWRAAPP